MLAFGACWCTGLAELTPGRAAAPAVNRNVQTQVGQGLGAHVSNTLQQQQVADLVAKAKAATSNGRAAEALALADAALKLDASHEMALFERGRALLKLQRNDEALAAFAAGLKKVPNSSALHYGAASANGALKRPREALGHYQALAKLDPKDVDWPLAQALLHSELGDEQKAVAALRQALAIDPQHADARTILATKLVKLGRVGEAADEYDALARLKPGDAQVKSRLAELRQLQKATDEAIASAKKAAAGAMPAVMDEGPPPDTRTAGQKEESVVATPAITRPVAAIPNTPGGAPSGRPTTQAGSVASSATQPAVADGAARKARSAPPSPGAALPAPAKAPSGAPGATQTGVVPPPKIEPVPSVPAPATGYYKLVKVEMAKNQQANDADGTSSRIVFGPASSTSSYNVSWTSFAMIDYSKPYGPNNRRLESFAQSLAWSIPDKIVPGAPLTFRMAASMSGPTSIEGCIEVNLADCRKVVAGVQITSRHDLPGTPRDVAGDEFTLILPEDLASRLGNSDSRITFKMRGDRMNVLNPLLRAPEDGGTDIEPRQVPIEVLEIPSAKWMNDGEVGDIAVNIVCGKIVGATYTYRWEGTVGDGRLSDRGPLEIKIEPAGRKDLRADGRDGVWVWARAKAEQGVTASRATALTQELAFAATGSGSDWLDLGLQKIAGGWKQIYVRASNPTPTTPDIKPPPALSITASVQDGSKRYVKTLQLAVTPNALLNAKPDLVEFSTQSGQTAQVKVALDHAGPDKWEFRAEFDRKDRKLANVSIKQDDPKSATLTLKEAGLDPLPNGLNDERATLKIFAEQKGRDPVERDIQVVVVQEGLFVDADGRDPRTNQYLLSADGSGTPTEIAFRVFAQDPKTKRIVNLTRDATVARSVRVECLEAKDSVAGRMLESGKFRQEAGGVRGSNDPAAVLRFSLAKELPNDGRVVPCDFRISYPGRTEPGFSSIITLGLATTGNGPGGKEWRRELDRCQEIINRFVPAVYTPRMQAMLDRRKMTLGAEGLFQLRRKIWSAAEALTLGEGGKGYADEAAWAGTITEALEWTQWAGDLAFGAVIGTFAGPYGAMGASTLKSAVISAINAYDEGRKPDEWLWDQFAMLPAMLEGKVIDPDSFQQWGMQSKAKAWALYISYHFLKNLWQGQSVVESLENTAKTVGNDLLAGWLNGEVAKHGKRNVAGWAGDKAKDAGQAAAKTVGAIQPAAAPTNPTAGSTTRPAPGPSNPPSDAETLVRSRTAATSDGKRFAHQDDVLEIMRDPSKVRALKTATAAAQEAFNNTRESIYGAHDAAVVSHLREKAATDPQLTSLRNRQIKVMEFRTAGASPKDINTDRDYRVCYFDGHDPQTGAERWIEVPRKHWEGKSYESFARLTGGPTDDPAAARAWAEKHQQLATDKDHAEASAAFSDQKRFYDVAAGKFRQVQVSSNFELIAKKQRGGIDVEDPQSLGRMYQQKVADAHFPHEKYVQANKAVKAVVELRAAYNVQGRDIGQIPKAIVDGIEVITKVNERLKADPNRRDPAAIADAERELRQAGHRSLDDFMNKLSSQLEALKWMSVEKDKRGIEIRR